MPWDAHCTRSRSDRHSDGHGRGTRRQNGLALVVDAVACDWDRLGDHVAPFSRRRILATRRPTSYLCAGILVCQSERAREDASEIPAHGPLSDRHAQKDSCGSP